MHDANLTNHFGWSVCIKVLQQVSELAGKDIGNQEVHSPFLGTLTPFNDVSLTTFYYVFEHTLI